MTYVKNPTWQDHPSTATPVTAAALNHMEDGIAAAGGLSGMETPNLTWPIGPGLPYYYDGYAQIAPMKLAKPMTFTALGINVATASASSVIRVGFWQLTDPSGGNFALLDQVGPFDGSSTGFKQITGLSITLPAGVVWAGAVSDGARCDLVRTYTDGEPGPWRGWAGVLFLGVLIGADATIPLPATSGPWNDSNTDPGCAKLWFSGVTYS